MQAINRLLENQYVSATLTLFLALYAILARPVLPPFLANLFENPLFRLFVLFLVAWTASRNAALSLMIAIAFTVTMNLLSEQRIAEGFVVRMAMTQQQ